MFTVRLKTRYMPEDDYNISIVQYSGGAPALQISDKYNRSMMRASVNVDRLPARGAIFIKNWSENEGIEQALMEAGLIGTRIGHVATGFVEATEHMMLGKLYEEWRNSHEDA